MPEIVADTYNTQDGGESPADYGLAAWTFPIWGCGASGTILTTAGSVFGSGIVIRRRITVTTLTAMVTVAGGTLTANNCWGMLYSADGDLRGQSVDQSTLWATAGVSAMPLTAAGAGLTLNPGLYWGAVVATGTTLPTFARSGPSTTAALGSAFQNLNQAAATSKVGVLATSITTTPADITPASITQATGLPIWFGVS